MKVAAKDEAGGTRIAGTQDRSFVWLAQTPQMFRAGLLMRALAQAPGANRGFVIFPSHWLLEGAAKVQGRRLSITGTAAELARDRVERAIADGAVPWEVDALGQGLTGKTVRARVIEYVPVRTRTGTETGSD